MIRNGDKPGVDNRNLWWRSRPRRGKVGVSFLSESPYMVDVRVSTHTYGDDILCVIFGANPNDDNIM